jgi:hypothetical protein
LSFLQAFPLRQNLSNVILVPKEARCEALASRVFQTFLIETPEFVTLFAAPLCSRWNCGPLPALNTVLGWTKN